MMDAVTILRKREQFREMYWLKKDPIIQARLLWRAQTFRHMVHLLPGQSILELGCGSGLFTKQLHTVSRGENPITAVTFQEDSPPLADQPSNIEFLNLTAIPGQLGNRSFDFIIGMDLLDKSNSSWLLQEMYAFLKPGGQVIFYESNPWNLVLQANRFFSRLLGRLDQRRLFNKAQLYELLSQLGFVGIFAIYNDFVYAPLTPKGIWWLRNLSILLENLPVVRTFAGSILINARRPPLNLPLPDVSLCNHPQLYKSVSVVVPCHNEDMNVEPLVTHLIKFYGQYLYEIVLVDDNSRDRTREVITRLSEKLQLIKPVFRSPPNGVGRAIMDGFRVATGRFILSMDCDFQHLLPELRDLFDAASDGYDVVTGSRFSRHSVLLNYPFNKIVANRAFHVLARVLFRGVFRDMTNNLKLFRREVLDKLELTQPGFAINAETGLMPLLMGYSVKEVPISWINRTHEQGVSSFKLVKVGGGYWEVLIRLWRKSVFKSKDVYPSIKLLKTSKNTTVR